jgi:hypothetical protein
MNTIRSTRSASQPTALSRTRIVSAASLASLALFATACSKSPAGPGVAQLPSTASTAASGTAPASSAPAKGAATPLAYSQCMRAHGVPDFPDPVGDRLELRGSPGSDLSPDSPQFKTAQKACKALEPGGGNAGAQPDPKAQAQALKYSACMRSHGLPNFADPVFSNGGIQLKIDGDPNSAQFKAAQEACRSFQPFGDGGQMSSQSDGPGSGDVDPSASNS